MASRAEPAREARQVLDRHQSRDLAGLVFLAAIDREAEAAEQALCSLARTISSRG